MLGWWWIDGEEEVRQSGSSMLVVCWGWIDGEDEVRQSGSSMLVVCWGVARWRGGETERSCRVVRDRRRSAEHHSTVADSVRRQAAQQIRQLRRRQFTFALNTHRTRNDMLEGTKVRRYNWHSAGYLAVTYSQ